MAFEFSIDNTNNNCFPCRIPIERRERSTSLVLVQPHRNSVFLLPLKLYLSRAVKLKLMSQRAQYLTKAN